MKPVEFVGDEGALLRVYTRWASAVIQHRDRSHNERLPDFAFDRIRDDIAARQSRRREEDPIFYPPDRKELQYAR